MSLVTGRRLRRNKFTGMSLPKWVVGRVHYTAQKQDQMWIPGGTPTISTNESSDEVPSLEENQVTLEEGSSNDEEEDESSTHANDSDEE